MKGSKSKGKTAIHAPPLRAPATGRRGRKKPTAPPINTVAKEFTVVSKVLCSIFCKARSSSISAKWTQHLQGRSSTSSTTPAMTSQSHPFCSNSKSTGTQDLKSPIAILSTPTRPCCSIST